MLFLPRTTKFRVVLVLWLIACVAVLVQSYIERNTSEQGMVLSFFMIGLTFPSGYAFVLFVFAPIFKFLEAQEVHFLNERGFTPLLIVWLLFGTVGYLQWFVLIPWLARKLESWFEQPQQCKP